MIHGGVSGMKEAANRCGLTSYSDRDCASGVSQRELARPITARTARSFSSLAFYRRTDGRTYLVKKGKGASRTTSRKVAIQTEIES